jgi:hypothetical protein
MSGPAQFENCEIVNNFLLRFFGRRRIKRIGEALSTGPNTGSEIIVRGVRTYSLVEFQSRLRERQFSL